MYQVEWQCQQIVARLFHDLDERNYDGLVNLFEENGVWLRQGKELKGREEIMAALCMRSPTYISRHVVSNFLFTSSRGEQPSAVAYMTAYGNDSGQLPIKPVEIRTPLGIFVVKCDFIQDGEKYRFARLELHPEFTFSR
jgi:hypothetical protein